MIPLPFQAVYGSSKAAVVSFTRCLHFSQLAEHQLDIIIGDSGKETTYEFHHNIEKFEKKIFAMYEKQRAYYNAMNRGENPSSLR